MKTALVFWLGCFLRSGAAVKVSCAKAGEWDPLDMCSEPVARNGEWQCDDDVFPCSLAKMYSGSTGDLDDCLQCFTLKESASAAKTHTAVIVGGVGNGGTPLPYDYKVSEGMFKALGGDDSPSCGEDTIDVVMESMECPDIDGAAKAGAAAALAIGAIALFQ